jgi:hypothetical protein
VIPILDPDHPGFPPSRTQVLASSRRGVRAGLLKDSLARAEGLGPCDPGVSLPSRTSGRGAGTGKSGVEKPERARGVEIWQAQRVERSVARDQSHRARIANHRVLAKREIAGWANATSVGREKQLAGVECVASQENATDAFGCCGPSGLADRARSLFMAVSTNLGSIPTRTQMGVLLVVAGPAARILSPSPNATNGASSATRREVGVTDFDCGAGDVRLRRYPTARWVAPLPVERFRGPTPLLRARHFEGQEDPEAVTRTEDNQPARRRGEWARDRGSRAFRPAFTPDDASTHRKPTAAIRTQPATAQARGTRT